MRTEGPKFGNTGHIQTDEDPAANPVSIQCYDAIDFARRPKMPLTSHLDVLNTISQGMQQSVRTLQYRYSLVSQTLSHATSTGAINDSCSRTVTDNAMSCSQLPNGSTLQNTAPSKPYYSVGLYNFSVSCIPSIS